MQNQVIKIYNQNHSQNKFLALNAKRIYFPSSWTTQINAYEDVTVASIFHNVNCFLGNFFVVLILEFSTSK